MKKAKISVCIASFNGAKYIKEQLESILSQLKPDDEVIISDDGSSDETLNIIKKLSDKRIRIFKHEKNQQLKKKYLSSFYFSSYNFENAIKHATGDIVYLSDQDDIWDKSKILDLYNVMLNNKDISVAACFESLYFNGCIKKTKLRKNKEFYLSSDISIKMLFHNFSGSCMCIKKEFYDKIVHYWNKQWAHDNFFWWFAFAFDSICILNKSLVLHRITGENASRTHMNRIDRINYCQNALNNINVVEEAILSNSDSPKKEKIKVFNKIKKGVTLRQKFLSSKFLFPFYGILLLTKYRFIYFKIKTFFGDVKSILFS